MLRIACECWVGAVVIRDILSPDRHDPLRMAGQSGKIVYGAVVDDPAGGVLRNAPDAPWVRRLRHWLAPG